MGAPPTTADLDAALLDPGEDESDVGLSGIAGFLRRLLPYLTPRWKKALLVLGTVVPEVAIETIQPLLLVTLIDDAIPAGDSRQVIMALSALLGLLLLYAIGELTYVYASVDLGATVLNDIRMAIFEKLHDLSVGFLDRQKSGDLLARFTSDTDAIENALVIELPFAVSCAGTIAVGSAFMLALDWRVALPLLVILPLAAVGPRLLGPAANRASYRRQRDTAEMITTVEEVIAAQPVVRAFGLRRLMVERFGNDLGRLRRSTRRAGWVNGLQSGSMTASSYLMLTMALGIGAFMAVRGELSVGRLIGLFELLWFVMASVEQLAGVLPPLQRATAGMERIHEILDRRPAVADAVGAVTLPPFENEISLDGVCFSYEGTTRDQLEGLTIAIPARGWIAIVGRSGSGKSTLLRLLTRFHDPTSGSILIDGRDLRSVTQDSVRSQMGVVFQDFFLFNTSVENNIRMGRWSAGNDEIVEAAKSADIHDFVMSLPSEYHTLVGDKGRFLSGGQKQRICLARALLRDPRILLLDEPASALDSASEAAINQTLRAISSDRTTISVTHRLASAAHADLILVLRDGRLVERGTHAELVAARGEYWALWEQQVEATL